MKNTDITALNEEIEKRIEEMEREDYEFPRRFTRLDYTVTAVIGMICLTLVICGAFIG